MDPDNPIPLMVAVGGSPESVVRAAKLDLGLRLVIIGGDATRFAPFASLYRRAQAQFGHEPKSIGYHSPGIVADTDEEAYEALKEGHMKHNNRIGRERGWPAMTESRYRGEIEHGALVVGSVETVAQKIARSMKALGADAFDLKQGVGSHEAQLKSIKLLGTQVKPRVQELLDESK